MYFHIHTPLQMKPSEVMSVDYQWCNTKIEGVGVCVCVCVYITREGLCTGFN